MFVYFYYWLLLSDFIFENRKKLTFSIVYCIVGVWVNGLCFTRFLRGCIIIEPIFFRHFEHIYVYRFILNKKKLYQSKKAKGYYILYGPLSFSYHFCVECFLNLLNWMWELESWAPRENLIGHSTRVKASTKVNVKCFLFAVGYLNLM